MSATFLGAWIIATLSSTAHADALRCGHHLITDGATRAEVHAKCGAPADIQTRSILRRPYYHREGRTIYLGDGLVETPVEIWTYNFGPHKLMRRVRFVEGIVEDIETLGYGYHDDERARR